MQPEDDNKEVTDAELVGLPIRNDSGAREPLEIIASQFLDKLRQGEPVQLDTFVQDYPHLEAELRDFLPLVAAMEDWKAEKELEAVKTPMPEEFSITQLGECRIIREIARGGMGVVFEAEQEPIGRRVAVKLLPWKFGIESKWSRQFHREAKIAGRLQHQNIVPVFNFGEQDGRLYYVMPLIQGAGLDQLILKWRSGETFVDIDQLVDEFHDIGAAGEAPSGSPQAGQKRHLKSDNWQQIVKIATQIVGAIRYAHNQGTLHRDIKPSNLLLDRSGKAWIADFGLAMGRDRAMADQPNSFAGTLRYMAPEQFQGQVDERSDIYSFGSTLFELCTLQPAFDAATRPELMRAVQQAKIKSPRSLNKDIPRELERIILRAMARDPEDRYQTAEAMYSDLLRLVNRWSTNRRSIWEHVRDWF